MNNFDSEINVLLLFESGPGVTVNGPLLYKFNKP